jgi:hypothetical protein
LVSIVAGAFAHPTSRSKSALVPSQPAHLVLPLCLIYAGTDRRKTKQQEQLAAGHSAIDDAHDEQQMNNLAIDCPKSCD